MIEGAEVCPPEYGAWSEFEPADDEECEENEETGKWTKPTKRYCNNPESKYGGICDGKFSIAKSAASLSGITIRFL